LWQEGGVNERRILIVGGDSLVGAALAGQFRAAGHRVLRTTRRRDTVAADRPFLDLSTAADDLPDLPAVDAVVLAAAVARIGDCETDPEASSRINVDGTVAVARAMAGQGAQVLFLSTDKVFDGSVPNRPRTDATCPLTEYGRQKAAAEAAILALRNASVLRLSKVLSADVDLVRGWLADLHAGKPITPFSDLYLAPVWPGLIGHIIGHIFDDRAGGIFHCTGAADRSYVDLARGLAARFDLDPALVGSRETPPDIGLPAARVAHTTLEMSVETERWGIVAPDFDATLAALYP
jgi:dTDP-4-dehydrorhamnose reductase